MTSYSIKTYGLSGKFPQTSVKYLTDATYIIPGYLASLNAKFGFNRDPHTFDLEVVKDTFGGSTDDLPTVGELVEFIVGADSFPIIGRVSHSDYSDSMNGTTINVQVQDRRIDLDSVVVFTDDIGDNSSLISKGIVSVGSYFRSAGRASTEYKEYKKIHDDGATYGEILATLTNNSSVMPSGIVVSNVFPTEDQISANIPVITSENDKKILLNNYRWKFSGQTLRDVITAILDDLGFDWYWEMSGNKVRLINRSYVFNIDPDNIPKSDDTNERTSLKYGKDYTSANNDLILLGAPQEGFIDSDLLSSIDGLDTPSNIEWKPAWKNITVGFHDAQGTYRTYVISEKEMQVALVNIEYWTYFKRYQSSASPTGWSMSSDDGVVAAQHPDFRSRIDPAITASGSVGFTPSGVLRYIKNRRDSSQNWILSWYDRVRQLASNNFGRTYYAEDFLSSDSYSKFSVTDAAWCNLENQSSVGDFPEGYKISGTYAPVAPFVTRDFKVSAHVVLPSTTLYGIDGSAAPAQFDDWNERSSDGKHFVPVELFEVTDETINPRSPSDPFERFKPGTVVCTLPVIATSGLKKDDILKNLTTLKNLDLNNKKTLVDLAVPGNLPEPYPNLNSKIAIPVRSAKRYGSSYPSSWTNSPSGLVSTPKREVVIDERFAPWNYIPGAKISDTVPGTSINYIDVIAKNFIKTKSKNSEVTTFGEVTKVGFPSISFDEFSDSSAKPITGITGISVQWGTDGYETSYSLKSHFDEFGVEAALGERKRGQIDGIIHPIDFENIEIPSDKKGKLSSATFGDNGPTVVFIVDPDEPVKELVVEITGIFNTGLLNERYIGQVLKSIDGGDSYILGEQVPPGFSTNGQVARCVDGFLDIGDRASYVTGRIGGINISYFKGGRDLTEGFIGKVRAVDSENKTVDVDYLRSPNNSGAPYVSINFEGIPLMNDSGSLPAVDSFVRVGMKNIPNTGVFTSSSQSYTDFVDQLVVDVGGGGSAEAVKIVSIDVSPAPPGGHIIVTVEPISEGDDTAEVNVIGSGPVTVGTEGILAKDSKDGKKYFLTNGITFRTN